MRCLRCRTDVEKPINLLSGPQLCDDCLADCQDHVAEREREFAELVQGGLGAGDARMIVMAREFGRIPLA